MQGEQQAEGGEQPDAGGGHAEAGLPHQVQGTGKNTNYSNAFFTPCAFWGAGPEIGDRSFHRPASVEVTEGFQSFTSLNVRVCNHLG